jgi:Lhr-like helicase
MSRQSDIVRQRLVYHFQIVDGTFIAPQNMPFMKEVLKEVIKLCDDFDKLSELSEKIDEAKIEISNAIRELKDAKTLDQSESAFTIEARSRSADFMLLSERERSEFMRRAREFTAHQRELMTKIRRIRMLAEDPEAKP